MAITPVRGTAHRTSNASRLRIEAMAESNFFAWTSVLAFAAIFWIWHSPAFYDGTLRNNVVYWLMHVTIFAAALALWVAVFSSTAALAFLLIFATCMQMSLLGALLDVRRRSPVFRA